MLTRLRLSESIKSKNQLHVLYRKPTLNIKIKRIQNVLSVIEKEHCFGDLKYLNLTLTSFEIKDSVVLTKDKQKDQWKRLRA